MTTSPVTVGVDLGGTGTRAVALTATGQIAAHHDTTTAALSQGPPAARVQALATFIAAAVPPGHRLAAVGIGASGPIDAGGVIRNPDTLPGFTGLPLREHLAAALGVPVALDNDCAAAALGEYHHGAGRGAASLLLITLGTGVGTAVVAGGRPLRACDGSHPEGGHITVPGGSPCYCGLRSCWEQAASRPALHALLTAAGLPSTGDQAADIAAAAAAAEAGERGPRQAFEWYGAAVGTGLATLATLYRPERVIIGGSVAAHLPLFAAQITTRLAQARFATPATVVPAALGDHAGAVGAAHLTTAPPAARHP
ncbi:ROK family protein [Bailinhaonella thermotolerans]|uniref:ROK family protein n=1 Tax=Bailinhaonella thermotolerans TaxID=1070861 RepID=A0A3A4AA05_9ACTN|nr:ROK family protein [Bailinhaonella thermotolerans]RJL23174.1 ROK family protein [Bailinhaonella thermotolerans]